MDPIIYEAAAKGNLEALEQYISDPLDRVLTVNKNTILHICISSILVEEDSHTVGGTDPASAAKFVEVLLDKCRSLLLKANAEDDTPLHVAARYGHASIVKVLFEHQKSQHQDLECGQVAEAIKEMIGKLNKERDTALHEAVRHNHIEVVKQLLMEVDQEFSFGANVAGETPLYLAAERCFPDLVSEILNRLKSPAYDCPLDRTALHAAAFWDDEDQNGWTPLHMAAYMGRIEPTKLLLKYDREVAYMKDADGRTALHIAAHCNKSKVIEVIISMCPDCCEVVDNEGRNALHLVKDKDGNTPLHHYSNHVGYEKRVLNSPRVDKLVFNKKNQNAYQIFEKVRHDAIEKNKLDNEKSKDKLKMMNEEVDKASSAHLVVAALITTVTFAAGITMPGGFIGGDYHPHSGSAVLRKSAAFQVFIISNVLSLVLSSSAVFIHLFIPLFHPKYIFEKRSRFLLMAFFLLLLSMAPMVLAFVTGTYAVLAHSSIAIPTCIIGLSFFAIIVYIFYKIIK
ncbi:hypothetical protein I3760_01G079100 [Carya illinoinensis]|nr:hypothetical protein I3760_01G079100 [Carya illinoinensis]